MNTRKMKLAVGVMCGLVFLPSFTHASTAVQLTDTTALFTIDFSFDDKLFVNEVPIAAEYGVTYLDRVDTVGYSIEGTGSDTPQIKEVHALVLSTAPIVGTRYSVLEDTKTTFQLFILATFTEPITEMYRAKITKLPYYLNEKRTTVHQNQLDELDTPTLSG